MKTSKYLVVGQPYSRRALAERFGIKDATMKTGVFKARQHDSIWLFITEKKDKDQIQYRDHLDGDRLTWDGQMSGRKDDLIRNHKLNNLEILVFYRKEKSEFAEYAFEYKGTFDYLSDHGSKPSHFVFLRCRSLEESVSEDLEAIDLEEHLAGMEGKQSVFHGIRFERNPRLRATAIQIHGLNCQVCGFNFAEFYGARGDLFIEVHHTKPISSFVTEKVVKPETDMAVVCSNCHRMIHRKVNKILSISELKQIVRTNLKKGD